MKHATVLLLLGLFVAGCGVSSPRFTEGNRPEAKEKKRQSGGPRFTSKHVEEEEREDDRKVDIGAVSRRFSSAPAKKSPTPPPPRSRDTAAVRTVPSGTTGGGIADRQRMMDVILGYLGTPYVYGGDSKSGIDCSAFTRRVYGESEHITLPRNTGDQVKAGEHVPESDLKFGDLLFFNTTGTNPSHVGIYIGDDLFAHASEAFGVTISSLQSSYYKKRLTEARRILQ